MIGLHWLEWNAYLLFIFKFLPDAVIEEEMIGKSQNQKRQKRKPTMTEHVSESTDVLENDDTVFDDDSELDEADRLCQMAVGGPDVKNFGKSSNISFTSTALKVKQELGIPSIRNSQPPSNQLWVNLWSVRMSRILSRFL